MFFLLSWMDISHSEGSNWHWWTLRHGILSWGWLYVKRTLFLFLFSRWCWRHKLSTKQRWALGYLYVFYLGTMSIVITGVGEEIIIFIFLVIIIVHRFLRSLIGSLVLWRLEVPAVCGRFSCWGIHSVSVIVDFGQKKYEFYSVLKLLL